MYLPMYENYANYGTYAVGLFLMNHEPAYLQFMQFMQQERTNSQLELYVRNVVNNYRNLEQELNDWAVEYGEDESWAVDQINIQDIRELAEQ